MTEANNSLNMTPDRSPDDPALLASRNDPFYKEKKHLSVGEPYDEKENAIRHRVNMNALTPPIDHY